MDMCNFFATGSTCDWRYLCKALEINSDILSHVDSKERLINIIQYHEQQTDGAPMTVRFLYDTLKSIKAKRAAGLLRKKALYVHEQHKRSASESQIQGLRRHHNLEKTSASFSYAYRQDAPYLDSLSESESETEGLRITTVAVTQSFSTMSSVDGESIGFTNFMGVSPQIEGNSSILTELDLSESQLSLTDMIKTAQLSRDNAENQKLTICSNTGIKFCPEAEFIIDVILSVNFTLSELVINGTNIRPRFSNCSKILANNIDMKFSLQHFYIANKFPLYLSKSDVFIENFVTKCSDKKRIIKVEEECPFDHTTIFTHYVDCEGGVYYYKDHDFALFIPPGAILQKDCLEIKVSSSFYGQYFMPQNYDRISSYVWVGASYNFKVPVYLVINHFVDIKSVKAIKALTAFEACKFYANKNNGERAMMHEIPTNYFDYDLRYCVISTDHFCTYCLAELRSSSLCQEYNNRRVFLANYYSYKEEPRNSITYIAEICCLYFNNNCLKVRRFITYMCAVYM